MIENFPARLDGGGMARILVVGVAANLISGAVVERFAKVPTDFVFSAFNPVLVGLALLGAAVQPRPLPGPWLVGHRILCLISASIGIDRIVGAFDISLRFGWVMLLSSTGATVVLSVAALRFTLRPVEWPDAAPVVGVTLVSAAALQLAVGPALFLSFGRSDVAALPIGIGIVPTLVMVAAVLMFGIEPSRWLLGLLAGVVVLILVGALWELSPQRDLFISSFGGDPGTFPVYDPAWGVSWAQALTGAIVPPGVVIGMAVAALVVIRRLARGRATAVGAEVRGLRAPLGVFAVVAGLGSLGVRWADSRAVLDRFGVSDGTDVVDWWSDVAVAGTLLLLVAPLAVLALLGDPARTGLTRRSWNLVLISSALLAVGSIHRVFDVLRAGSPLVAAANRLWPAGPMVVVLSVGVLMVQLRQWRRPEPPPSPGVSGDESL
ncbi:MAG: hypothetical protein GY929_11280 [Actinomycetia bacterium]|nr:hypothetical protein [Actinomycetes bacterium]